MLQCCLGVLEDLLTEREHDQDLALSWNRQVVEHRLCLLERCASVLIPTQHDGGRARIAMRSGVYDSGSPLFAASVHDRGD